MRKTERKGFLKNLSLLAIVLIICFTFLEIIFRIAGIGTLNDEVDSILIKHGTYNPFLIFGPDINREIEQKNGEIAYWNSQGFRMKENLSLEKPDSEYRIIALGGSTTENLPNRMNLHYPQEAGKILNSENFINKEINIVNSGKSAYSSAHSLIRLQFDLLPFKPDMITVMHNMNDLTVNFYPDSHFRSNYANKFLDDERLAQPFNFKDAFLRNTFLGQSRFVVSIYEAFSANKVKRYDMRYADTPVILKFKDSFRNNLIAISRIAKAHNITVVLMSQPAGFTDKSIALGFGHRPHNKDILYPRNNEFKDHFEEYNKVIKEVADSEDVYFIDMYNLMGHDEKYFTDVLHYTPEGINKFSDLYARELKKMIEEENVK